MMPLLIGNFISLRGCLTMVGIGFLRKRSHILTARVFRMVFDLYSRSYTAMAFDIFTMLSNLYGIFLIRKGK